MSETLEMTQTPASVATESVVVAPKAAPRKVTTQVSRLSEGNTTAWDGDLQKFFVPKDFRADIKVGSWINAVEESFQQSRVRDAKGNVVKNPDGTDQLENKPFTRMTISFVGSLSKATMAAHVKEDSERIGAAYREASIAKQLRAIADNPETLDSIMDAI